MMVNSRIKRILVVRPDAIGDCVLVVPLINTLKSNFPEAKIYVLVQSMTKNLFSDHPSVEMVIEDWRKAGRVGNYRAFKDYVSFIKSFKFDVAICPYLDFFYAFLVWKANIKVRIGDMGRMGLNLFLNNSPKLNWRNLLLHETEQNIALLKKWKPNIKPNYTCDLFVEKKNQIKAEEHLKDGGWQGRPYIVIHPFIGMGNRAWLPECYTQLIDLIYQKTSFEIVLSGSEPEKKSVERIIEQTKVKPISLVGKTSLSELKAIIKKASLMIGAETGPVHMASAFKVPVVSISPTKFIKSFRWGPWQTNHIVLGDQSGCHRICHTYKDNCEERECIESIEVQAVFQAVQELINTKEKMPKDAKKYWFIQSAVVGFYIGKIKPNDIDIIKHGLSLLDNLRIRYIIFCRSKKVLKRLDLEEKVKDKIVILSPFRIFKYLKLIAINDITVINNFNKLAEIWLRFIIQFSALDMYAPPLICNLKEKFKEPVDIVNRYFKEFNTYYETSN